MKIKYIEALAIFHRVSVPVHILPACTCVYFCKKKKKIDNTHWLHKWNWRPVPGCLWGLYDIFICTHVDCNMGITQHTQKQLSSVKNKQKQTSLHCTETACAFAAICEQAWIVSAFIETWKSHFWEMGGTVEVKKRLLFKESSCVWWSVWSFCFSKKAGARLI